MVNIVRKWLIPGFFAAALGTLFCLAGVPFAHAGTTTTPTIKPTLQKPATPRLERRRIHRPSSQPTGSTPSNGTSNGTSTESSSEPEQTQPGEPQGGRGMYVMDNVDFHPVGGGEIPGLTWNNKVPVTSYYNYGNNSYLIVSGTVHGAGLISGPGQDGWTFVVHLDTDALLSARPTGCSFAQYERPQTDPSVSNWKYQLMIVFNDTASKPACFDYFKSLGSKPFMVKLIDIVGPYWTGNKQYQEPKIRYYGTGPMLQLETDPSSGHAAEPWSGPLP